MINKIKKYLCLTGSIAILSTTYVHFVEITKTIDDKTLLQNKNNDLEINWDSNDKDIINLNPPWIVPSASNNPSIEKILPNGWFVLTDETTWRLENDSYEKIDLNKIIPGMTKLVDIQSFMYRGSSLPPSPGVMNYLAIGYDAEGYPVSKRWTEYDSGHYYPLVQQEKDKSEQIVELPHEKGLIFSNAARSNLTNGWISIAYSGASGSLYTYDTISLGWKKDLYFGSIWKDVTEIVYGASNYFLFLTSSSTVYERRYVGGGTPESVSSWEESSFSIGSGDSIPIGALWLEETNFLFITKNNIYTSDNKIFDTGFQIEEIFGYYLKDSIGANIVVDNAIKFVALDFTSDYKFEISLDLTSYLYNSTEVFPLNLNHKINYYHYEGLVIADDGTKLIKILDRGYKFNFLENSNQKVINSVGVDDVFSDKNISLATDSDYISSLKIDGKLHDVGESFVFSEVNHLYNIEIMGSTWNYPTKKIRVKIAEMEDDISPLDSGINFSDYDNISHNLFISLDQNIIDNLILSWSRHPSDYDLFRYIFSLDQWSDWLTGEQSLLTSLSNQIIDFIPTDKGKTPSEYIAAIGSTLVAPLGSDVRTYDVAFINKLKSMNSKKGLLLKIRLDKNLNVINFGDPLLENIAAQNETPIWTTQYWDNIIISQESS